MLLLLPLITLCASTFDYCSRFCRQSIIYHDGSLRLALKRMEHVQDVAASGSLWLLELGELPTVHRAKLELILETDTECCVRQQDTKLYKGCTRRA